MELDPLPSAAEASPPDTDMYDAPLLNARKRKKTRSGCDTCKERHLKCDEQKPACLRCRTGRWNCVYSAPLPRKQAVRRSKYDLIGPVRNSDTYDTARPNLPHRRDGVLVPYTARRTETAPGLLTIMSTMDEVLHTYDERRHFHLFMANGDKWIMEDEVDVENAWPLLLKDYSSQIFPVDFNRHALIAMISFWCCERRDRTRRPRNPHGSWPVFMLEQYHKSLQCFKNTMVLAGDAPLDPDLLDYVLVALRIYGFIEFLYFNSAGVQAVAKTYEQFTGDSRAEFVEEVSTIYSWSELESVGSDDEDFPGVEADRIMPDLVDDDDDDDANFPRWTPVGGRITEEW